MKKNITVILIVFFILLIFVFAYVINNGKIVQGFENTSFGIDKYVGTIYYINLDNRPDRKREFLSEISKIDFPNKNIVRIPGVYKEKMGGLGCSLSHIKALNKFIHSNENYCMIFEDDFIFNEETIGKVREYLFNLFENNISFDVCMLSGLILKSEPTEYKFLNKVINGQTASGYIVSKAFAPVLLQNFTESAQLLEKDYSKYNVYALDQYWKQLQPSNNWYIFYPKLGKQRASFSNIEGKTVNYENFTWKIINE